MKQEPVAWIYRHKKNKIQDLTIYQRTFDSEVIEEIPLYTKSQNMTLSEEEIEQVWKKAMDDWTKIDDGTAKLSNQPFVFFAKSILRKAQEK